LSPLHSAALPSTADSGDAPAPAADGDAGDAGELGDLADMATLNGGNHSAAMNGSAATQTTNDVKLLVIVCETTALSRKTKIFCRGQSPRVSKRPALLKCSLVNDRYMQK